MVPAWQRESRVTSPSIKPTRRGLLPAGWSLTGAFAPQRPRSAIQLDQQKPGGAATIRALSFLRHRIVIAAQ
jgi:hypothetical protein